VLGLFSTEIPQSKVVCPANEHSHPGLQGGGRPGDRYGGLKEHVLANYVCGHLNREGRVVVHHSESGVEMGVAESVASGAGRMREEKKRLRMGKSGGIWRGGEGGREGGRVGIHFCVKRFRDRSWRGGGRTLTEGKQ